MSETTDQTRETGSPLPMAQQIGVTATRRFWAHEAAWNSETDDAAIHFAAMAFAYLNAWTHSVAGPQARDQAATSIVQYWKPFVAAYTTAALLRGNSINRIREHLLAGDLVREQLWEWLSTAGFTDDQVTGLSVLPPALHPDSFPDHVTPDR